MHKGKENLYEKNKQIIANAMQNYKFSDLYDNII